MSSEKLKAVFCFAKNKKTETKRCLLEEKK